MRIDLHTHTRISSPCSIMSPEELIQRAMETGLDAVCVTEHNSLKGAIITVETGKKYGFKVFKGMELHTPEAHILAFGVDYEIEPGIPATAALDIIEAEGGAAILAHPFRSPSLYEYDNLDHLAGLDLKRFAAIEVYNSLNREFLNEKALKVQKRSRRKATGGSDAHSVDRVGKCYTVFEHDIETEKELVGELLFGSYKAECAG